METNFDRFAHDESLTAYMFKAHCMCKDCKKCELSDKYGRSRNNGSCFFHWLAATAKLTPVKKIKRIGFDYSPVIEHDGCKKYCILPTVPYYQDAVPTHEPYIKKIVLCDGITKIMNEGKKVAKKLQYIADLQIEPIEVVSSRSFEDAIKKWNALVDKLAAQGVVEIVK